MARSSFLLTALLAWLLAAGFAFAATSDESQVAPSPVLHCDRAVASADGTPLLRISPVNESHVADILAASVDTIGEGAARRVVAATASNDKTIRLWSIPDGIGQVPVAFSPKVFRVPVGPCSQGRVYAVAVSLKKGLLAAGGYFGVADEKPYILIYNIFTGELIKSVPLDGDRINARVARVRALAFSPDGEKLAAGIDNKGAAVWRTSDWSVLMVENASNRDSKTYRWRLTYGVAWSRTGLFAAARTDGRIRVYGPDLKRLGQYKPDDTDDEHHINPYRIAFSPDGEILAVGYQCYEGTCNDETLLTLHRATRPDVVVARYKVANDDPASPFVAQDTDTYGLESVAWSSDGQHVYAGGTAQTRERHGLRFVYAFDTGLTSPRRLEPEPGGISFSSGISDILTLPDAKDGTGRILAVSTDSLIQVISTGTQVQTATVAGPSIDLRWQSDPASSNRGHLCVSDDGRRLTFPHEPPNLWQHPRGWQFPCTGDAAETPVADAQADAAAAPAMDSYVVASLDGPGPVVRIASAEPGAAFGVKAPVDVGMEGLDVGWIERQQKQVIAINGMVPTLADREQFKTFALSPEDRQVVVLTTFRMMTFAVKTPGAKPVLLWNEIFEAEPARVNVVGHGDKRLVVVGFVSGTVNWYRLRDHKQLLTLFVTNEKRMAGNLIMAPRWVLWTPEGYYDASPGAEELIGWHINRPGRTPVFVDINRFRREFNRPDVVRGVLETLDVEAAAKAVGAPYFDGLKDNSICTTLAPSVVILDPKPGTAFQDPLPIRYRIDWQGFPCAIDPAKVEVLAFVNGRPWDMTVQRVVGDVVEASISGLPRSGPVGLSLVASVPLESKLSKVPAEHAGLPSGFSLTRSAATPVGRRTLLAANTVAGKASPPLENLRLAEAQPSATRDVAELRGGAEAATMIQSATAESQPQPKHLYALLFGVSRYSPIGDNLPAVRSDVADLATTLKRQELAAHRLYDHVDVHAYPDDGKNPEPTLGQYDEGFNWLQAATASNKDSVVLIYFAGHGTASADDSFSFWLSGYDPGKLPVQQVSEVTILDKIRHIHRTMIIVLDTCDAGRAAIQLTRLVPILANNPTYGQAIVIAATRDPKAIGAHANAFEIDRNGTGHGLLTQFLIKGLKEAPVAGDDYVTVGDLYYYINNTVAKAARLIGKNQDPVFHDGYYNGSAPLFAIDPGQKP